MSSDFLGFRALFFKAFYIKLFSIIQGPKIKNILEFKNRKILMSKIKQGRN